LQLVLLSVDTNNAQAYVINIISKVMENVSVQERNSKLVGYATTTLFHGLVLLLLWMVVWGQPDPPLDSGGSGFTVALGLEEAGGSSLVPVDDPSVQEPTPPTPDPQTTEQPVVTQDEGEENTVIDPPKTEPKKTEPKKPIEKSIVKPIEKPAVKPVEQPRKADEKSLFKKRTTTRADESGYGAGEAPGNQGAADGDPNGDPNGNGYGNGGNGSGTGIGDGIGSGNGGNGVGAYELKGRTLSRRPVIEDNTKETGKVVVSIVVDRSGRVTKAMPNQKGTTTLNPTLLEKAKQAALDTRFSPNTNAPEEQFGTMTIVFKFKP
jgi:protein TonB